MTLNINIYKDELFLLHFYGFFKLSQKRGTRNTNHSIERLTIKINQLRINLIFFFNNLNYYTFYRLIIMMMTIITKVNYLTEIPDFRKQVNLYFHGNHFVNHHLIDCNKNKHVII